MIIAFRLSHVALSLVLVMLAVVFLPYQTLARPLNVTDVLGMERLDRVTVSPDGRLIAAVVLRPAAAGEVFGRAAHEVDPSRGDIWIIDRSTGKLRDITAGRALAAGAWCATWSPDGRHLAFLSTRPEGAEPRGGDNVRLYIWDRDHDRVRRLGDWPVMTQTRYGGAIHALDIAGPGANAPDACLVGDEQPPFAWLDPRRLVVVALPPGQVSGLIDEAARPDSHIDRTRSTLRAGNEAIVSVAGSGAERTSAGAEAVAVLAVVDAVSGKHYDVASVPAYPFHGALGLRASPDGTRAALLAPVALLPPREGQPFAGNDGDLLVEKRLGVVNLAPSQDVRWLDLPPTARLPVELSGWYQGRIGLTARATAEVAETTDFVGDLDSGAVTAASTDSKASSATSLPPKGVPDGAILIANDAGGLVWSEQTSDGTYLRAAPTVEGPSRDLLVLNRHLAAIDWGKIRHFDYPGPDGRTLQAAVLLPPDYHDGQRLPVIVWVYGGASVPGFDRFSFDPQMPGLYNLHLYAARGYAVLIPSIPLTRDGSQNHLEALAPLVEPAVDRLVAMGIADSARVGLLGQSYGGFTALGLATTSDRFRAVVAIAPLSDFTAYVGAFDPSARGYPGIEHEKSGNAVIAERGGLGLQVPPLSDPGRYALTSPLTFVNRVKAPVLLIHGERDVRGAPYQSEAFFSGLWRQGKTAKLLRYWGEDHALARSPATLRTVTEEITAWFDRYLAPTAGGPAGTPR